MSDELLEEEEDVVAEWRRVGAKMLPLQVAAAAAAAAAADLDDDVVLEDDDVDK